jgi:hypothetical protein
MGVIVGGEIGRMVWIFAYQRNAIVIRFDE